MTKQPIRYGNFGFMLTCISYIQPIMGEHFHEEAFLLWPGSERNQMSDKLGKEAL